MGLFCEAVQLLHLIKSTTEPHTSEQSDSPAPQGQTIEELSHCSAVMWFIHSELLPSPLLPRGLGASLCLSAHTLGGRALLPLGIKWAEASLRKHRSWQGESSLVSAVSTKIRALCCCPVAPIGWWGQPGQLSCVREWESAGSDGFPCLSSFPDGGTEHPVTPSCPAVIQLSVQLLVLN